MKENHTVSIESIIEQAWPERAALTPTSAPPQLREAVEAALADLDAGRRRVAEKVEGAWVVQQWLKKAVLLSFRLRDNALMGGAGERDPLRFYDKADCKCAGYDAERFPASGVRVVP